MKSAANIKVITAKCILLLLAAALFANAISLVYRCRAAVPNALACTGATGLGVPVSAVLPGVGLSAASTAVISGGSIAGDAGVSATAAISVRAVTASATWGKAAAVPMISGGWYLADAVQKQHRYIVLPDTLALALFGSTDIGGSTVTLQAMDGAKRYEICGVYHVSDRLLDAISRPAEPTVYLSCPPMGDTAKMPAQQALLTGTSTAASLLQTAAAKSGQLIYGLQHDLRAPLILAGQLVYIALILCACLPLWRLLRFGGHSLVRLYTVSKNNVRARDLVIYALRSAGCIVIACTVLWLLLKNISIPAVYLPADNIFDFAHYKEVLVRFYQAQFTGGGQDVYRAVIGAYLPAIAVNCAAAVAAWYAAAFIKKVNH